MPLHLLLSALLPLAADRAPAPQPGCLDARAMQHMRALDTRSLLISTSGGRYRLETSADCPGMQSGQAALLARDGWVCGAANEFVRTDTALCPVATLRPLAAREYAELARNADALLMAAVETRASRGSQRGFRSSHEYCLRPSLIRSWSADAGGIVVRTDKRRSGGNGSYRVEFGGACPETAYRSTLTLRSGVGIDLVCGNPGDIALLGDENANAEIDSRFSEVASSRGCAIAAVFPIED